MLGRLLNAVRSTPRRLVQYVGDDTLLLYGQDRVFIYADGRDASLTPCLLRNDGWEPALAEFLSKTLRPGDCFVDVGANIGIHSLRAAGAVGAKGLVVAFEPQQRLADLFHKSLCANLMMDTVQLRRLAIGAEDGTVRLGKFAHLSGSATLTPNHMIVEHEDVPIKTLPQALAEIAAELGRPIDPTVIKIDVEGFEYAVWQGMRDWARSRTNLTIVLEFSPVSYRNLGHCPTELLADFADCGFHIATLTWLGGAQSCSADDLKRIASTEAQTDLVISK